jgi:hypothetical protein
MKALRFLMLVAVVGAISWMMFPQSKGTLLPAKQEQSGVLQCPANFPPCGYGGPHHLA